MVLIAAVLLRAGEQNRQQPRGARGRVGRFGLKRKLLGKEAGKNVMPRRTGPMDICDYCDKKFWAKGLLVGKYVCNFCCVNDPDFLFAKNHFYDALAIQTKWRLSKGKPVKYMGLYLSRVKKRS